MYKFGPYQLDPTTIRLFKDEIEIEIEPQVFNTLLLLVENRDRVITKEQLLVDIWHGRAVTDHVITRIIYELRKILDDKHDSNSHIRTVRGKGYQFIADVLEVSQPVITEDTIITDAKEPPLNSYKKWGLIFLFLMLLLWGSYLLVNLFQSMSNSQHANPSDQQRNIYPTVSVLPINISTGNEELSMLVQALIDYLTNQLTINLNMKVIHPDSLLSMGDDLNDVWAIQNATKSDFIIQGFIESATDDSINLHLTLYKNNAVGELNPFPLGAFEFPYPKDTRELNDLYKQLKVTVRSIVKIIKPGLTVNDDGNFETSDPEAYRLVIAAHHMSRSDDCKDMARAEQLLLQAVKRDDEFVYAYLQLFTNYYKRVWICGESTDFHQKGLEMAEIIDQLAPNTYHSMAIRRSTILVESNQVEQAFEFSRNADWNNPDAIYDKSYSLRYAGFLNAASKNIDRILLLDPFFFSEKPIEQAPNTLLYQNRFAEHLTLLAAPGNSYHDYFRGFNLYLTGNFEQAKNILEGVVNRTPEDLFGQFSQALVHIINDENHKAMDVIDAINLLRTDKKHTDGEMTYKLAQLYALAEAEELALKYLQLSVDQGFFPMNYFLTDPALQSIKHDHRYLAVIKQATQRHESFAVKFDLESETLIDSTE